MINKFNLNLIGPYIKTSFGVKTLNLKLTSVNSSLYIYIMKKNFTVIILFLLKISFLNYVGVFREYKCCGTMLLKEKM